MLLFRPCSPGPERPVLFWKRWLRFDKVSCWLTILFGESANLRSCTSVHFLLIVASTSCRWWTETLEPQRIIAAIYPFFEKRILAIHLLLPRQHKTTHISADRCPGSVLDVQCNYWIWSSATSFWNAWTYWSADRHVFPEEYRTFWSWRAGPKWIYHTEITLLLKMLNNVKQAMIFCNSP